MVKIHIELLARKRTLPRAKENSFIKVFVAVVQLGKITRYVSIDVPNCYVSIGKITRYVYFIKVLGVVI